MENNIVIESELPKIFSMKSKKEEEYIASDDNNNQINISKIKKEEQIIKEENNNSNETEKKEIEIINENTLNNSSPKEASNNNNLNNNENIPINEDNVSIKENTSINEDLHSDKKKQFHETEIKNESQNNISNNINNVLTNDLKEKNSENNIDNTQIKEEKIEEKNIKIENNDIPTKSNLIEKENEPKENTEIINLKNSTEENNTFISIENILEERQRENNIVNNNHIYFTEANTLVEKPENDIHKSNSNKLYVLTSIPEVSNAKKNIKYQTPIKDKLTTNKNSKNKNLFLNNLSPEIYMKKKYTTNKDNEINSLKYRIKKYEEEIQKQNEYDYKKAMKECQVIYDRELKNKEKQKQILEEHKKMEEKLKNMEEYRNNLANERIQKIIQRQNRINKNINKNNINQSHELTDASIKNKSSDENAVNTIDSYDGKLPILPNMPKHEIYKLIKENREENFCINTEKRLKTLEVNHRRNYLNNLTLINDKLVRQNELYNKRSAKCIMATKDRTNELQEEYIAKDSIKRYNIRQNLLRDLSEKKDKRKDYLLKNIENVKEKKELLEKEEKEKINKILKRLNRKNNIDIKKNLNNNENNSHRVYFYNKQKENLNKANKEIDEYYKELILEQEDYLWMVRDIQKHEPTNKLIIKNTLDTQNKKNMELKSLNKFLEKMDKDNINNQKEGTKMKIFLQHKKMEIENKNLKEDEININK